LVHLNLHNFILEEKLLELVGLLYFSANNGLLRNEVVEAVYNFVEAFFSCSY
jgi:hypothetical protein